MRIARSLSLLAAFSASSPALLALDAALAPGDTFKGKVDSPTDVDVLEIGAIAGESLEVVLSAATHLEPSVALEGAAGEVLFDASAPAGGSATVQTGPLAVTGTYRLVIRGLAGTTGKYVLKTASTLPAAATHATLEPAGSGAAATFEGRKGLRLSASIAGAEPRALELAGPFGPLALLPFATATAAGAKLKKLPLGAAGTFVLTATAASAAPIPSGSLKLTRAPAKVVLEVVLKFTFVPEIGAFDDLAGSVKHKSPAAVRIAVFIHVPGLGWWTKPTFAAPLVVPNSKGKWTCDITTGGADASADFIAAFALPSNLEAPGLAGAAELPPALFDAAYAARIVQRP